MLHIVVFVVEYLGDPVYFGPLNDDRGHLVRLLYTYIACGGSQERSLHII